MLLATMSRRLAWLLALTIGIALLVWQVRAVGVERITQGVRSVGVAGMLAVMALSCARFHARAVAWLALLREPVAITRAVAAVIAGDAAGNLTPLSLLVGEPAKAAFLRAPGGAMRAFAALAAETYFFAISVAIYVVGGTAAMLWTFDLDRTMRTGGIAALAAMAIVLAGAGWIGWRRPGLASAVASRIPIKRVASFAGRLAEFETTLYGTVGGDTTGVRTVIAAEIAVHVLSFAEMWLCLWLVVGQSLPLEALVLDAFGRVGNVLFKVIPLQLGILQIGSEIVTVALGLPPGTGTTLSIVRTVRVLAWAGVGLGLWGSQRSEVKSQK